MPVKTPLNKVVEILNEMAVSETIAETLVKTKAGTRVIYCLIEDFPLWSYHLKRRNRKP